MPPTNNYLDDGDDFGYPDDIGFDDEAENMSAEDRARLDDGIMQVRVALKTAPMELKVTTAQIEAVLWNNWFDVRKSLNQLTKMYSRMDPTAGESMNSFYYNSTNTFRLLSSLASLIHAYHIAPTFASEEPEFLSVKTAPDHSFSDFFSDMPWGNVPKHRMTTFISPQPTMTGGLLGGAPSKLQALAARRKKKTEKGALTCGESERTDNLSPQIPLQPTLPVNQLKAISLDEKGPPSSSLSESQTREGQKDMELHVDVPANEDIPDVRGDPSQIGFFLSSSDQRRAVPALRKNLYPIPYMNLTIPGQLPPIFDFSTPSPDDKALAAQAEGAQRKSLAKTKKEVPKAAAPAPVTASAPTAAVGKLKIEDHTPLPTYKKIEVVREWRHRINPKNSAAFVVVGHVDHGKSTMMGRLLLELGVVEERTINKFQKEAEAIGKASFRYAWVMDTGSLERERGVTIDVAVKGFSTNTTEFTILDAPGHSAFVPSMLAGTTYADFAVLVVDASRGAFESGLRGETEQHTLLLRCMGIKRIIVAVNKMDSIKWSQERFEDIVNIIKVMLKRYKFSPSLLSFVPVSGLAGHNLVHNAHDEVPESRWYIGPTLLEELEKNKFDTESAIQKPLRMDVVGLTSTEYTGGSVAVTGRLMQGHLQIGEPVVVEPSGKSAYVRFLNEDYVVAGQYVRVVLSHIDAEQVRPGDVLCSKENPIPCVRSFSIKGLAFNPILPGPVEVVRGRMYVSATLRLVSRLHPKTGEIIKMRPAIVKPGEFARFRILLKESWPLEEGQRVVIRDGKGMPIVAGLVEASSPQGQQHPCQ